MTPAEYIAAAAREVRRSVDLAAADGIDLGPIEVDTPIQLSGNGRVNRLGAALKLSCTMHTVERVNELHVANVDDKSTGTINIAVPLYLPRQ